MEEMKIKNRIINILNRLFGGNDTFYESLEYVDLVEDLGMESISFISLIIEIEEEFVIQIPDEWLDFERFKNYSMVYSAVTSLLEKNNDRITSEHT